MPLPIITTPSFNIIVPSTKESVKFRQFLVKEEKMLLAAVEADDEMTMLDATMKVLSSCAVSPIKPEELAVVDVEYIFLQLRAHSVSDVVDLAYRCRNVPIGNTPESTPVLCGHVSNIKLNLNDVNVIFPPDHTRQIFLTDTIGINMKYPSYNTEKRMLKLRSNGDLNETIQAIALTVESLFDDQSVYTNFQPKEIVEWLEHLTQPQFERIRVFFEKMPVLAHDVMFKCDVCGYSESIHLEGLQSFVR